VRSDNPASDLFFSPLFKVNMSAAVSLHHFLRKQEWTRHLQVKVEVENVSDAHVSVHDRNGRVPNRFQRDLIDPIGRTVKLTLRKLI
jgi:iron complex outermembrane receptor protein